jgi:hypothetical protein
VARQRTSHPPRQPDLHGLEHRQKVSPTLTIDFRQARSSRLITQEYRLDRLDRCLMLDGGMAAHGDSAR